MNLGFPELLVIFAIALLLFGPKRLPDLAKSLGKAIRDFKKAMHEDEPEDRSASSSSEKSENHAG